MLADRHQDRPNVPPPNITSPQVPTRPPLGLEQDEGGGGIPSFQDQNQEQDGDQSRRESWSQDAKASLSLSKPQSHSPIPDYMSLNILSTPPIADFPSPDLHLPGFTERKASPVGVEGAGLVSDEKASDALHAGMKDSAMEVAAVETESPHAGERDQGSAQSHEAEVTMGEGTPALEADAEEDVKPDEPEPNSDLVDLKDGNRPQMAGNGSGPVSEEPVGSLHTDAAVGDAVNGPIIDQAVPSGQPEAVQAVSEPIPDAATHEIKAEHIDIDASMFQPGDLEALASLNGIPDDFAPPPPPPEYVKSSNVVEHVDVDLGPLKSVSRNHAKIEYLADIGHFCIEIYGRNGAWVDDRYYVKGSIVPLNQG